MNKLIKNKKQQLHKGCLIAAILHWMLTFFTDHLVFDYVQWDMSNMTQMIKTVMTYGAKCVFLLVLIALWQAGYYFVKKANRRFVAYSLAYFVISMLLLLLVWPGIWRMDEFGILNSAVLLLPVFWQSYLTSLFYIFAMMLIPIPTGVIIVQCACISLIVGYLVNEAVERFGKFGLLTFVPCLFLPVLDSNLYPMRMSLYAFLEVLLVVLLYKAYDVHRKVAVANVQNQIGTTDCVLTDKKTIGNLYGTCILAAIVTVWRTEAIYYFVLFPVLMWILCVKLHSTDVTKDKTLSREKRENASKDTLHGVSACKKTLIKFICFYLVAALVLFVPQKVGDKLTSGNQYDLTSVVLPLVPLVQAEVDATSHSGVSFDGLVEENTLLRDINQVVDVHMAYDAAKEGRTGISLFWSQPEFQKAYSDAQYQAFKSAYYQLILRHPDAFFEERMTCFWQSQDLLQDTTVLTTDMSVPNHVTFAKYPATSAFDDTLRADVIKTLEWRDASDYSIKKAGYSFVYGAILPIIVLVLAWAYCALRRKWAGFFLISLPLVKLPLIFLTAPSRLFMYYYGLYLLGYLILAFAIMWLMQKVWDKVANPVTKTINYAKRNGIKAAYHASMERIDKKHMDYMSQLEKAYCGARDWANPVEDETSYIDQLHKDILGFGYQPKVSIVVPTYETNEGFFAELLDCVVGQVYDNWELVLADASPSDKVKKTLDAYLSRVLEEQGERAVEKVKYIKLEKNAGISDNTNVAIDAATGDYIALLDHDDLLTKDALYFMVEKLNRHDKGGVIAVYSDEDKCNGDATDFNTPHYKTDLNREMLLSNNYICHFLMVRQDVMKALKLRAEYDGAQDYDLILRLLSMVEEDGQNQFLHVGEVLYHWRCHEASTASNTESKRYAYEAGKRALMAYYERMGLAQCVEVTDSMHLGFYDTTYQDGIFVARDDVVAICGRVVKKGVVVGGPKITYKGELISLFDGTKAYSSAYKHRADTMIDVDAVDERALKLRDGKQQSDLATGYVVYDPTFIVVI